MAVKVAGTGLIRDILWREKALAERLEIEDERKEKSKAIPGCGA